VRRAMNKLIFKISAASLLLLILACTAPKNEPRYVNEGPRTWQPVQAPVDQSVEASEMSHLDHSALYSALKNSKTDLMSTVLLPLSRYVLNAKFTATPANRTLEFSDLVGIFESAFDKMLERGDQSPAFAQIKDKYYKTVFDGCARDMKTGCTTADYFARQPLHMHIFTLLARELDATIDKHIKAAGNPTQCVGLQLYIPQKTVLTPQDAADQAPLRLVSYEHADQCRDSVEQRYRLLSMATYQKTNQMDDSLFNISYMKYARIFALLVQYGRSQAVADASGMTYSYAAESNPSIFQTIIGHYQPTNYQDPEFKAFVNNFNPWTFSHKSADIFQYGTNIMFEYATKCCLYDDKAKAILSPAVSQAITESQAGPDQFGPSFRQLVQDIKKEHAADPQHAYDIFANLGILDLVKRIEDPKSDFFNEYFFIVDRLFRGHLHKEDAEKVLANTDPERTKKYLPKAITDYAKIYLVAMVVETNRFMAHVYQSGFASDQVFQEAQSHSRDLTDHWHSIEGQISLLNSLLSSYFSKQNLNENLSTEYGDAYRLLKGVNRNIHYLSVFPNMMVMTYFLSTMNSEISIDLGWGGQPILFKGATILKEFFDGEQDVPWFAFGQDPESLNRSLLMYSLEYLLSTEALNSFTAEDAKSTREANRSHFFDVIFTKYLDSSLSNLRKSVSDYENSTLGSAAMVAVEPLCKYELGQTNQPLEQTITLFDLQKYTYAGIGADHVSGTLNKFLGNIAATADTLRGEVAKRRLYVRAMIKVIAQDLIRNHKIANENQSHPDLDKARSLLQELNDLEARLVGRFLSKHRQYYKCAQILAEVERRRTKRLYQEEREYFGSIYDTIKTQLNGLQSGSQEFKDQEAALDRNLFPKTVDDAKASSLRMPQVRFDHLDDQYYYMSLYDLLMRMRRRLVADVFMTDNEVERRNYGASYNLYRRPRPIKVDVPLAVEQNPMVQNHLDQRIYFGGSREDFIRQGLAAVGGRDSQFLNWQTNFGADTGISDYLHSLEQLYLLGPVYPRVTGPTEAAQAAPNGSLAVSLPKEDLINAYIQYWASLSLDSMDRENNRDFSQVARFDKSFFQNKIFDRDGQTRLPFFHTLMRELTDMANVSIKGEILATSNGQVAGVSKGTVTGPTLEALRYARTFNNMQAFVFQPSNAARDAIHDIYGENVNRILQSLADMFSALEKLESQTRDAAELDPRLRQPFYVESGIPYYWYDRSSVNLVDHQISDDHRILIQDFIQQTNNFFDTREKVKFP
jgi:hypothetical protein